MSIDQEAPVDSVISATEDLDSVSTGSNDSQDDNAQADVGESDTSEPDDSDSSDDSDGSFKTADTTLQKPSEPVVDYKAELDAARQRISDLRSGYSKKSQEHDSFRKQYDGVDAAAIKKWKEDQERATQQNLPVFNPRHPENAQFKDTLIQWKQYKSAFQRANTPEEKDVLNRTLGSNFTQKQQEQIQGWEQHQQRFHEQEAIDPMGARAEQIQQEARSIFQEEWAKMQHQQEELRVQNDVTAWMEEHRVVVDKHRLGMMEKLSQGWPLDAVKYWIAEEELKGPLQSRVSTAEKSSAIARAQQNALKDKATVTRDPAVEKTNPQQAYKKAQEYAKKHNLPQMHPRVMKYLSDIVDNSTK